MREKMKRVVLFLMVFCLLMGMTVAPVEVHAASKVALNKTKVTIVVGETVKLKLKNAPAGKTITWSSNKKAVAAVDQNGKVTAKKNGTAKITAKVNGKNYQCKVIVKSVLSVSGKKINIEDVGSIKVTFNKDVTAYYEVQDSGIVEASWSREWSGETTTLDLTGKKSGITYVTISNSYNNEEIKIEVNVNLKEPEDEQPSINGNVNKLINCIINKGKTKDGDKYLEYKSGEITSNITYHPSSGMLAFDYTYYSYDYDIFTSVKFDYDISTQTAEHISIGYMENGLFPYFRAEAPFNINTYDDETNLYFQITSSIGMDHFNIDFQEYCNIQTRLAVLSWNIILITQAGLELSDIGFLLYD